MEELEKFIAEVARRWNSAPFADGVTLNIIYLIVMAINGTAAAVINR